MQKGFSPIIILVGILIVALTGGGYYFFKTKKPPQIACTLEAKICPDGTGVGRSGLNCEFAPCPSPKPDETANWKTYTNEKYGFSIKYPNEWFENVHSVPSVTAAISTAERKEYQCGGELCLLPLNHAEIGIWVYLNKTINDLIDSLNIPPYTAFKKTSESIIKIDALQGQAITYTAYDQVRRVILLSKGNDSIQIELRYYANDDMSDNYQKIFNQILSTFKFD